MIQRNENLAKLKSGYLFPEINKRKNNFLAQKPTAELISLGIGDTTQPIPQFISNAMSNAALQLGFKETYKGYGPEQGYEELKAAIAKTLYHDKILSNEVFISDGAKCDIGRLQTLFGPKVSIAVQDPSYPVYVDGSIMHGVEKIVYMPCLPENQFFPDLDTVERTDLIYFCAPNNPTGTVATKEQLKRLVDFAKKNHSIIIYDSAYASFITDPTLPKSIYEIEGAKEVAIETGSFSKIAGFTGVRLGWTIVPQELKYSDGTPVKNDWHRLTSTIFNGASIIAQAGGIATLQPEGIKEVNQIIQYYLENARLIKDLLEKQNFKVFGGENAPYLWVHFEGKKSWDVFQTLLENFHIISTPGSGFGSAGEGFIRFTAFAERAAILKAIDRLKNLSI
jgi:LL-diaminopimelate aminotransferase